MGWLSSAAPVIAANGAPWLIVFILTLGIVRYQRRQYDERIAEQRAHTAEVVGILKDQIATGATSADTLSKLLTHAETTQRVLEALPKVGQPI